jgi:hypothetical protein
VVARAPCHLCTVLQVVVAHFPAEGRGVCATQRLQANEAIITVPAALLIDAAASRRSSSLGPLLPSSMPEWPTIAVFLAELQHWHSHPPPPATSPPLPPGAQQAAQQWRPYLLSLPQQLPGTALDWQPQQLQRLLQGSPLLRRAKSIQQAAQQTWEALQPVVEQGQRQGLLPAGAVTQQGVRWALAVMVRLCRWPAARGSLWCCANDLSYGGSLQLSHGGTAQHDAHGIESAQAADVVVACGGCLVFPWSSCRAWCGCPLALRAASWRWCPGLTC